MSRGVRTAERYEVQNHSPIHRPAGQSVIATRAEVDARISNGVSRQIPWDRARSNRARANFLLIDSAIALTFSGIALETSNEAKKRRTTQAARKAYETITRLKRNTDLGDADINKLETNLRRLKSELHSLGQSV